MALEQAFWEVGSMPDDRKQRLETKIRGTRTKLKRTTRPIKRFVLEKRLEKYENELKALERPPSSS